MGTLLGLKKTQCKKETIQGLFLHVTCFYYQELRKSGSFKQQLEVYKRQVLELQTKVTEETKRADKSEFEVKRIQEKISTLQREKEVSTILIDPVLKQIFFENTILEWFPG